MNKDLSNIFHLKKIRDCRVSISSRNRFIDNLRKLDCIIEEPELETLGMTELDNIFKAIRLVPDFDGNPNVLTRFVQLGDELAKQFFNFESSDLTKCAFINGMLNKVVGSAARLINTNGVPQDWSGIRSALINNFADQRDETALYNDLALLVQGQNSPQEYYERCQSLFSTIMTYVSLHETVATTIAAKRDLYKRLTLQAYLRGLKDPLGSRIRCMRPATIEKALEYVHEENNTIYLQSRNDNHSERKHNQLPAFVGYRPSTIPNQPAPRPYSYNMHGPSKPFVMPQQPSWKPHFNQVRPAGPSRTMQIFRAAPPNYNPNQNNFQMTPKPFQNNQPRPMSGVSHFVTKPLPPTNALSGHDWYKSGNPPPTNYFKTREMNFSECVDNSSYDDYYYNEYYEPYYGDESDCQYAYECEPSYASIQEHVVEHPQSSRNDTGVTKSKTTDQNFQEILSSDTLK